MSVAAAEIVKCVIENKLFQYSIVDSLHGI